LRQQAEEGYYVCGAFHNRRMLGRVCLAPKLFGSAGQYMLLESLHITLEFRGQGIGKRLFALACEKAKERGAQKLYISAYPAHETIQFYLSLGCREAEEIDPTLGHPGSLDRQLEFLLGEKL